MNLSLNYLIRAKDKIRQNPLLLLLHGYGSNAEDLFSFANELPDEYYVIAAQALMIFNTAVMLGTRSILMQTKINFQITNRQNLLEI
jgi:predicted esterase